MKKIVLKFSLFVVTLSFANFLGAQNLNTEQVIKYRRSSLHNILIQSGNFPNSEIVIDAYNKAPFPANYNQHAIENVFFNPYDYKFKVTDEDRNAAGKEKNNFKKEMNESLSIVTAGIVDSNAEDMPLIIKKFIEDQKIGNKLVAKWYNRKLDGSFDMKLIEERGQYDASQLSVSTAKASVRGVAALADAGEELIQNTFVVFSRMNFIPNEIIAAAIRDASKASIIKMPAIAYNLATKGIDKIYEKTKEGYSVWTTSYLFKLKWDETVASIFYDQMYFDNSNLDSKKKAIFDNSDIFEMEYIGTEKSSSLVTFSLKKEDKTRTEDQVIEKATVRNVNTVFSKLQKKYDVFKPKVPLLTGDPITAKIGVKEGLDGGEKFEVLEQNLDPKTNKTIYKRVGIITVEKDLIWDNRYNLADEQDLNSKENKLDRTTFKGGSKYYPGMLIREIKN